MLRPRSLIFTVIYFAAFTDAFPIMLSKDTFVKMTTRTTPLDIQFDPMAGMPGVQYVERLGENCTGFSLEPDGDLFGDVLSCYIRCSELAQCRGYVMTLDGIRCTLKGYDCQLANDAQSVFYEKSESSGGNNNNNNAAQASSPSPSSSAPALKWSTQTFASKSCGSVPVVENAFVTGSSKSYHDNKPGDVVMFSCLPGYDIAGISKLTCLGTGQWDNNAPMCIAALSLSTYKPLIVDNSKQEKTYIEHRDADCEGGELTGWIRDRQTCEAACVADVSCHGFIVDIKNGSCVLKTVLCKLIEGTPTRASFIKASSFNNVRKAPQTTSTTTPTSTTSTTTTKAATTTTTTTTTTESEAGESTTSPDGTRCSPAPEIENGIIYLASTWALRRPGDWVSYNCIQGYVLSGSFLISCLPDGSWEYPPECVKNVTTTVPTTMGLTTTRPTPASTTTSTSTSTTTTTQRTTSTSSSTVPTTVNFPTTQTVSLVDHKHPRFVITNLQCSHADTLTTPFLERSACEEYCLRLTQCDGYTVSVLKTNGGQVEGTDCVPRRRCSGGFVASSLRDRTHNFYKKITLQHHRPMNQSRPDVMVPFPTISPMAFIVKKYEKLKLDVPTPTATTTLPFTTSTSTSTTTSTPPSLPNTTQLAAASLSPCQDVPKIPNGFVYLSSSFTNRRPGDWVTYECDQGFRMTGKFIVKCLEDGTWEPLPSCSRDGSAPPSQTVATEQTPGENDLAFSEQRESSPESQAQSHFKVSTICMTDLARFRKNEEDPTLQEAVFVVPCVLAIHFPLSEIGLMAKKKLKVQQRSNKKRKTSMASRIPKMSTLDNLNPSTLRPLLLKALGENVTESHKNFITDDGKIVLPSDITPPEIFENISKHVTVVTEVMPTMPSNELVKETPASSSSSSSSSSRLDAFSKEVVPMTTSNETPWPTELLTETTTPTITTTVDALSSNFSNPFDLPANVVSAILNDPEGGGGGNVLDSFEDIGRNCRGDVVPNGEFGDMQDCARNCLAMGELCNGFTALNERGTMSGQKQFKCMLKGKNCQLLEDSFSEWTFYKKFAVENNKPKHAVVGALMPSSGSTDNAVESLFEPIEIDPLSEVSEQDEVIEGGEPTACIKVLEEMTTRGKPQCEGHCLRRRTTCLAYTFQDGLCQLIGSLDCSEHGEQIFKKSDGMRLFRKLNGNCKGGEIISEIYDVTVSSCAVRCHRDKNCRGFTFVNGEKKCVLKSTPCPNPELYNYDVVFWEHKFRP